MTRSVRPASMAGQRGHIWEPFRHPRATTVLAAVLGITTFLVFLPAVNGDFVNVDDQHYVQHNPLVREGLSLAGLRHACTAVTLANWAPLTTLSLQADASVFGPGPWGFHLTNVMLHAATAAVLFLALSRMTGSRVSAAAAVALFAWHPLRVESVAWVSERKDALSVFLLAVTLLV